MNEYMTDEELNQFISNIEENDLVEAPPEMETKVFNKINKKSQIIEYKRFRNRVVAAVAAILIIPTVAPMWEGIIPKSIIRMTYDVDAYIELENNRQSEINGMRGMEITVNSHYISDLLNGSEE